MSSLRKSKDLPVRRKKLINFEFLLNLSWKKILIIFFSLLFTILIITFSYVYMDTLKVDRYRINESKYLTNQDVNEVMSEYLNQRILDVDTNSIQEKLKSRNPLIKEIAVNKSIIEGIVIHLTEYNPLCIVQTTDNKAFIITDKNDKIEISNIETFASIVKVNYLSANFDDPNFFQYLNKVLKIKTVLQDKFNGNYSFDNFGNLSILLQSSKLVRLDLNERFYTIDEQSIFLQDTLAKNSGFSEIDLRFSYFLIK